MRFAAVSSSIVMATLLAKNYQSRSVQVPAALSQQEKNAQEKLEKDIKSKLGNDLHREIGKAKLQEFEKLSHELRSKLIPSITEFKSPFTKRVIEYFTAQHHALLKQYRSQEEAIMPLRNRIAADHDDKPIALFGYILSQRHHTNDPVPGQQWLPANQPLAILKFLEEQVNHPEQLLFKNEINPRDLLKTALLPGEIAFSNTVSNE